MSGIADLLAAAQAVAGVAHQLRIPDAGSGFARRSGIEDRDRRPELTTVEREAEMVPEGLGDFGGFSKLTAVSQVETLPVKPADAPFGVAPSDAGGEGEFLEGFYPDARLRKLGLDRAHARARILGGRRFMVEFADKLGGLLGCRECRG